MTWDLADVSRLTSERDAALAEVARLKEENDRLHHRLDDACEEYQLLADYINEYLPEYHHDRGDGTFDEANEREKVEWAADEIRELNAQIARLVGGCPKGADQCDFGGSCLEMVSGWAVRTEKAESALSEALAALRVVHAELGATYILPIEDRQRRLHIDRAYEAADTALGVGRDDLIRKGEGRDG